MRRDDRRVTLKHRRSPRTFEQDYAAAYPDELAMAGALTDHNPPIPDGRCIHRGRFGRRCKRQSGSAPDLWWCSVHCPLCNRDDYR